MAILRECARLTPAIHSSASSRFWARTLAEMSRTAFGPAFVAWTIVSRRQHQAQQSLAALLFVNMKAICDLICTMAEASTVPTARSSVGTACSVALVAETGTTGIPAAACAGGASFLHAHSPIKRKERKEREKERKRKRKRREKERKEKN